MAARTRDPRTVQHVLDNLTSLWEKSIRDAFFTAISDVTDNVLLNQLIDAIEVGDVERVFRQLGFNERSMRPIVQSIERAYEAAQMGVFATFPVAAQNEIVRAAIRFDMRDVPAEMFLRDRSSNLIVSIQDETRTVIRNTLQAGMERGDNPRRVALDLVGRRVAGTTERAGGVVGLAPSQERWVSNARRQLETLDSGYFTRELRNKRFDRIVARAIESGKPLSPGEIERITGSYSSNVLRYRGETIGRTEALHALNAGTDQSIRDAVEAGTLDPDAVKRVWDATGDARTRRTHMDADGQEVGLNNPFMVGGYPLMYPLDDSLGAPAGEIINCRCRVRVEIDWFRGYIARERETLGLPPEA